MDEKDLFWKIHKAGTIAFFFSFMFLGLWNRFVIDDGLFLDWLNPDGIAQFFILSIVSFIYTFYKLYK